MKSIMQDERECYICRYLYNAYVDGEEEHHIFPGTANRRKSEEHGLKVWLCANHHRLGDTAVHRNAATMEILKLKAQEEFEKTHTREEFIKIFGRSYW